MSSWQKIRAPGIWLSGLGTGLLIGIGMLIGGVVVTRQSAQDIELPLQLPAQLQATATSSASTFAIATGLVSDTEGIFFLDFLTGDLQCVVLYKNGLWGARFVANVFQDLDVNATKKPNFLMVTGTWEGLRGVGGGQPGRSVVYVVDSTTGSFAVYGVLWNRQAEVTGTVQGGNLVVLQKGRARNLQIRDQ
jgi:hypothetical protein